MGNEDLQLMLYMLTFKGHLPHNTFGDRCHFEGHVGRCMNTIHFG